MNAHKARAHDIDSKDVACNLEHGYYEIVPNNMADINWDNKVDMKDVGLAALAFGSFPSHPK